MLKTAKTTNRPVRYLSWLVITPTLGNTVRAPRRSLQALLSVWAALFRCRTSLGLCFVLEWPVCKPFQLQHTWRFSEGCLNSVRFLCCSVPVGVHQRQSWHDCENAETWECHEVMPATFVMHRTVFSGPGCNARWVIRRRRSCLAELMKSWNYRG